MMKRFWNWVARKVIKSGYFATTVKVETNSLMFNHSRPSKLFAGLAVEHIIREHKEGIFIRNIYTCLSDIKAMSYYIDCPFLVEANDIDIKNALDRMNIECRINKDLEPYSGRIIKA